jgi:PAS domain S-box-containing protein
MNMEGKTSILIVDDDEFICKSLKTIFTKQGYETEAVTNGRGAIERAKGRFFNLALLDIKLPDMEGTELLSPLKDMHPDMAVIIITGYASLESAVEALNEGASAYVTKPLKKDVLLATARGCLEKQQLAADKLAAEQALRENEQRYRMLVETMNDGLGLINRNGVFTYLNDKHCQMLGYSRDEIIGHSITDFLDESSQQKFDEKWAKPKRKKNKNYELVWKRKDGQQITTIISPQPIFDARNNFQGAFAVVTDITEHKRAEEELQREKQAVQRAVEERDLVARVGRIISSTLQIEKVYELFAGEVHKVIPFERITITIIDYRRGTFWNSYILGNDVPGRGREDVVPLAGSLTEEAMCKRSSQLIQRKGRGEIQSRFPGLLPCFQAGLRSFMAVPLISKDKVIGVLHLQSTKRSAYTEENVNLAESIGSQIAGAIANAQLYEETKRAEKRLQRLAEERDLVARVGRIISSTLEIEKVYELFAEEVGKAIPFDRIAINLTNTEDGTFSTAYIMGLDIPGRKSGDVVSLAGSLTEGVMRSRTSLLLQPDDIDEVVAQFPRLLPTFQAGVQSLMAVPLISKDRVIGVLHLRAVKPKAYTEANVKLAESIGSQIAGAIANAKLYAEHKRAEDSLARQAQELARSNAELEQFAYVASHDLQEPLRKIQAFGDRLKAHCNEALGERGRDYLQRMQNAASRLQRLINDLLTFSRVTTRAQPFVPVDLAEVAREVVSDLELRIERTGGRVEMNGLPTIDADTSQMRQLLQNLIDNGLKFHRPEEAPNVKVYGKLLNGRSQIIVEDNGIGFDEKYLDRIFTIFQRLHARLEYEGTGVGLAVCRKIAERHGGTITAKSKPGEGSTFIVTLPVKQTRKEEMRNG